MKFKTKRLTILALLVAVALILSLVENALPPILSFAPGVKIGLANAVILFAIIALSVYDATIIVVVRCVMLSVFAGNVSSLLYSLPAGLAAMAVQFLVYKFLFPHLGLIFISLVGACIHNGVQLLVASVITETNLFYIFPLMFIASVIAGLFIGIMTTLTIKYLPKKLYLDSQSVV